MKKRLFPFILLTGMIFSACQNQCPPLTDHQKADIEKQILEIYDSLIISFTKLDVDGIINVFSSDEFLGYIGSGTEILSKTDLRDNMKGWFSYRNSQKVEQKKVRVNVLTKDIVLVDILRDGQIDLKSGESWAADWSISLIFKKENSGWKIIHDHESTGNVRKSSL